MKPGVLTQIEDAIVARLKERLPGDTKVEPWPDSADAYDFANLTAAALVHYTGSRYTAPTSGRPASQAREAHFAVHLFTRNLRGHSGGYQALEAARLALQDNTFAGSTPATIVSDQLVDEREGQWQWLVEIAVTVPAIGSRPLAPRPFIERTAP